MKIMMLLLSLFVSIQVYVPNEETEQFDSAINSSNSELLLLNTLSAFIPEELLLPRIQHEVVETKLAGVSTAEKNSKVSKADLDDKAGQIDWSTAIIILCVAVFVCLINKSKKQNID